MQPTDLSVSIARNVPTIQCGADYCRYTGQPWPIGTGEKSECDVFIVPYVEGEFTWSASAEWAAG